MRQIRQRRRMGEKGITTPLMVSQMVILPGSQAKRDHDSVNGIINGYYLPGGYIAPHRVAHDLTDRQREILHILSKKPSLPLREIRAAMDNPPSDRRLREDVSAPEKTRSCFVVRAWARRFLGVAEA